MTATLPKIPDPLVVLRRAEQRHTGEEPGDLDHLADAVRTQIVEPLTAGDRPVVDDVQVKQLQDEIEKLRTALTLRTQEVDEARAERDTARAQLRDRPAAAIDTSVLEQAQRDNARLADELARARRDLRWANQALDEIADEEAARPAHRHEYEVDTTTGERKPCACRKPWIRVLVDDGDPVEPDIEPLDALFARIRNELQETT